MKKDLLLGAPKSENILRGAFGVKRASVFSFLAFESRVSFTWEAKLLTVTFNLSRFTLMTSDVM